jgi:hypothetical protein
VQLVDAAWAAAFFEEVVDCGLDGPAWLGSASPNLPTLTL